jgi:hypothetical protein
VRRSGLIAATAIAALTLLLPAVAQGQAEIPHIRHVFIVVLENESADATFGPASPAPYLAARLRDRGLFAADYYATGHLSLDNYISMVSGQAPNVQTQTDCRYFTDFLPGIPAAGGQVIGSGCVYPRNVETIGNQLAADGRTWKGYMEDMGTSCRHPEIGARDDTQSAEVGDQYATRHNPFVYFHSIIDTATCAAHDVDFSEFHRDIRRARTTPNYSFITPNLCNDGHDEPCVDGRPGGLVQANRWLRREIPPILASPAYRRHGDRDLRRGRGRRRLARRERLLRRAGGPEHDDAGAHRARRRAGRRGDALALHRARDDHAPRLQPLLDAALDRGQLRASAPRLCRPVRAASVRSRCPQPPRLRRPPPRPLRTVRGPA